MANGIELATAYVSILPELRGLNRATDRTFRQIETDSASLGTRSGRKMGRNFDAATAGIGKSAYKRLEADSARSGKVAGGRFSGQFASIAKGAMAGLVTYQGFNFFKDSVIEASDLEQSVGGLEAVFKKSFKSMQKSSEDAAMSLGLSRNEYNELATTLGSTLKNKGIDGFAKKTQNLIGLGSDLSATYGGDTKEAVAALSSAMRGEMDPIERYGITMNQTMLEAEAYSSGIVKRAKDTEAIKVAQNKAILAQRDYNEALREYGKGSDEYLRAEANLAGANSRLSKAMEGKKVQLTDNEKAQAALSLINKQSADAQGRFAKESDTYAGQLQRFYAQVDNIQATLGKYFLPYLTSGAKKVNTFLAEMQKGEGPGGRFRDMLTQIKDGAKGLFDLIFKGDYTGSLNKIFGWDEDSDTVASILNLRDTVTGFFSAFSKDGKDGAKEGLGDMLSTVSSGAGDLLKSLPSLEPTINLISKGLGWMADNTDKVGKALPWLLGAFATYKTLQAANNVLGRDSALGMGIQLGSTIALTIANRSLSKSMDSVMKSQKGAMATQKAAIATENAGTAAKSRSTLATLRATVAEKARTVMTKIGTAAQRVFNAVMSMNPLAKVVLVLTAVGAGLVLLYKKNETFRKFVNAAWASIQEKVKQFTDWFVQTAVPWIKKAFTAIGNFALGLWRNYISPAFKFIWGVMKNVWGWLQGTAWPVAQRVFSLIGSAITTWWSKVVKPYFGFVWSLLKTVFGWLKNTAWPTAQRVFTNIGKTVRNVWTDWIKPNFDRIKTGAGAVIDGFKKAYTGIKKHWGGLKAAVSAPVSAALNFIDRNFLSKIRTLLKAVGLDDLANKIPSVAVTSDGAGGTRGGRPTVGGRAGGYNAGQFYTGGWTGPGSYLQPAGVVHADEFVVKKTSRRRFEQDNPGVLDHINRTGRMPGYAIGGKVAGLNKKFYEQLSAFNAAAGGKYSVYSGYRSIAEQQVLYNRYLSGNGPVAARPGGSQHNFGLAADLSPSNARVDADLARRFGLVFTVPSESWHIEPTWGRKGGGGGGVVGGGADKSAVGGLLGKVIEKGKSALNAILNKAPRGFFPDIATGLMRKTTDGLARKITAAFEGPDGGSTSGLKFTSKVGGSNVDLGRQMAAARGWTGQQWLALKELWTRESNWNHLAKNPSSGAYGIPQSLPGSKMATSGRDWMTNPNTQIDWGLKYIAQRYGNPMAALAFHNRMNWYNKGGLVGLPALEFDRGGMLPKGRTVVENNTGKPEPLGRLDTMKFGAAPQINVYVWDPTINKYVETVARKVVADNDDFSESLNRRK